MCGITGFLDKSGQNSNQYQDIINKMTNTLIHRGPDDYGYWVDEATGIALGHRRLSIIDLSKEGHQPMISPSGRYHITYNGEIYNYLEIRQELNRLGCRFRGHSDTETILLAIEEWGLSKTLEKMVGMFAFALWDKKQRKLHLCRDRIGEKPLYYGWGDNNFVFASELKAIKAHPYFNNEIDRDVLALYMRYNYVPAPYSIYKQIFKLLPGHHLSISTQEDFSNPHIEPYWSVKDEVEKASQNRFEAGEKELMEELERILSTSVKRQMISDVPLGAFLSGGIDSSTIVALMQANTSKAVKTFSIGFHEDAYNEAVHAKKVAQHLGTDHTELYLTAEQTMKVIPNLPAMYDEPFADSSQIPTHLVAQLARQKVTVSLSGDGGDELFGGYNRYFWGRSIWNKIGWIPAPLRSLSANSLKLLSPHSWDSIFNLFSPILPSALKQRLPGDKIYKIADVLNAKSSEHMYRLLVSSWKDNHLLVPNSSEIESLINDGRYMANLKDFTERMMYLDLISYLPDDILVKVDRASMAVSLESRIPFLDHNVVEFAWRIPLDMKIRDGEGKWLLKQLLYKYVPKELIDRPKMGFGVPIDSWLREPLREWAEDLLAKERLEQEGFFNSELVREKWDEHLSGKRNWQHQLWAVLMFQAWKDEN